MTTQESPVTPGNDAVLREWAVDLVLAAHMNDPTMNVYARLRSLCEAVAAAERDRAAGQLRLRADCGCGVCELARKQYTDRIRSLRGLPEIGRPRE